MDIVDGWIGDVINLVLSVWRLGMDGCIGWHLDGVMCTCRLHKHFEPFLHTKSVLFLSKFL